VVEEVLVKLREELSLAALESDADAETLKLENADCVPLAEADALVVTETLAEADIVIVGVCDADELAEPDSEATAEREADSLEETVKLGGIMTDEEAESLEVPEFVPKVVTEAVSEDE
jgi:hypothetical protein